MTLQEAKDFVEEMKGRKIETVEDRIKYLKAINILASSFTLVNDLE